METLAKRWLSNPTVAKLVGAAVGMIIIILIVRFFQRSLTVYIKDPDTRYRARKFISVIGYVSGIVLIAVIFSDRLGRLAVVFGVAGAGIAFALQEVITSIAGWVAVSFGHFYKTGDRIQMGGIKGDVIDIGILRTTVMECGEWVEADLYNGRIVRVANSFIFKEPVFNYTSDFPFVWDEIVLPVKYGSDMQVARDVLQRLVKDVVGEYAIYAKKAWEKIVDKYMIEAAKVEPAVTLIANENWVEFTVRYVVDYKERRATKNRIFTHILDEFEKTEGRVEIASTSTDIHLIQAPPFDVRLAEKI
jgi:small-conductance mechanosensitive channel